MQGNKIENILHAQHDHADDFTNTSSAGHFNTCIYNKAVIIILLLIKKVIFMGRQLHPILYWGM